MRYRLPILLFLSLAGCAVSAAPQEDLGSDESAVSAPDTASTHASGDQDSVKVRAGSMTVWFDTVATRFLDQGRVKWRLRGRTSKNISDAFSFVPDDPFGEARALSARTFEVVLDGQHEMSSMLSGSSLLVRLTPTSGVPHFARLELAPRLARFDGDGRVFVLPAVKPIFYRDGTSNLRYRGSLTTSTGSSALTVLPAAATGQTGARSWRFDWTHDAMLTTAGGDVRFEARLGSSIARKEAEARIVIEGLSLTTKDPYDTWPQAPCDVRVLACMRSRPVGTSDLGDCGTYRQVLICTWKTDGP